MIILTSPIIGEILEDNPFSLIAYITGAGGAPITVASMTAIAYVVFDLTSATPDTAMASGSFQVNQSVFDTPRIESGITYNFRGELPAGVLTDGGHVYDIEVQFIPVAGEVFRLPPFRVTTQPLRSI